MSTLTASRRSKADPSTGLEFKTSAVRVKAMSDGDPGTFSLYAAIFGNVDLSNEMIAPNAFRNLQEFVEDGFLGIGHQWSALPVGTIDAATQDRIGLLVSGRWHSTPEAQAARTVVKERLSRGKSVKASVGYRVLEDEQIRRDEKTFRLLKAISIFEASLVNVPANPRAGFIDAKGAGCGRFSRGAKADPVDVARAEYAFFEAMLPRALRKADPFDILRAQNAYAAFCRGVADPVDVRRAQADYRQCFPRS